MATNILMPALSPTMTEGTLARWLKKEGETIKAGDVIAEIETDKATMEVEAVDEGVLGRILVQDGTEGVRSTSRSRCWSMPGRRCRRRPRRGRKAVPAKAEAPPVRRRLRRRPNRAGRGTRIRHRRRPANGHDADGRSGFLPRRWRGGWRAGGHRPGGLKGSGPNGRIVRADIEAAQKGGAAPAAAGSGAGPGSGAGSAAGRAGAQSAAPAITRAAQTGAAQFDAQSDRPAADRGEVDHSAFLRLDGYRDRRADRRCMNQLNAKSPKGGQPGAYLHHRSTIW